jgi:hypothetical protein
MKNLLLLFFTLLSLHCFSQTYSLSELEGKDLHNSIRLNYILVHQPVDEVSYNLQPTMGFVGLNYNIPLNDWFYTGIGFHTAITGDQGGLFTLGVNLGVNTKIHFSGGEGYRSLVYGVVIPNSNLQLISTKVMYNISKKIYLTAQASFVYEGESRGYASGVFSLGIKSSKFANNKLSLFTEAPLDVAGGERLGSGENVLVRPTAGINYHVSNDFSFNITEG